MTTPYESDGRGPTTGQLFLCGIAVLAVTSLVIVAMLAKSTGRLEPYVRVVANLVHVGDGLPPQSDVKYHGLLVGSVDHVVPVTDGRANAVHINLDPDYARSIPATVTARVVPSNVFAVSSVQLVDRTPGPPIQSGDHVSEDDTLPTVLFQTTISKLRDILAATGRGREDHTVGVLAAVQTATENRRGKLLTAGAQLNTIIDQLDSIVGTDTGPTTISALINAARGLQQTAPDLLDSLHTAVRPMQTLVQRQAQLRTLLTAGITTVGTTQTAMANHSDQLVTITGHLTPVLGVLAQIGHNFLPAFTKLNALSDKFFNDVWIPELDTPNLRGNVSLTPSSTYSRADCPQYGALKGNSCFTAPLIPVRPDLPEVLLPQNYQPPADLAPPPGTAVGPDGNLIAVGPPLINPNPNLTDPNPPLPPGFTPAPPVPQTANPALGPPEGPFTYTPPAPVAPKPGDPPSAVPPRTDALPAEAAPAAYGGNVGPVGSPQERNQLGVITGHPATVATQLLLAPVVRGMTVSWSDAPAAGRPR